MAGSLWLVRLPDTEPQDQEFCFQNFNATANRIAFDAQTNQDGYILTNEIEYPGWRATIDGEPVQILRADGIFRALWVPAGRHRIEFRFWPRLLLPGAVISLATLIAVLIVLSASRPSRRPLSDSTVFSS